MNRHGEDTDAASVVVCVCSGIVMAGEKKVVVGLLFLDSDHERRSIGRGEGLLVEAHDPGCITEL
jgi:hypothetical protein